MVRQHRHMPLVAVVRLELFLVVCRSCPMFPSPQAASGDRPTHSTARVRRRRGLQLLDTELPCMANIRSSRRRLFTMVLDRRVTHTRALDRTSPSSTVLLTLHSPVTPASLRSLCRV